MVDILTGTLVRSAGASYKSYLSYFIPPLKNAREHLRNERLNISNFLRRRLYQDFGMKELIERFYNSIRTGGDPPIPYREIIFTARIMDEIFAQIYPAQRQRSEVRCQKSDIGQRIVDDAGQISEVRGQTSTVKGDHADRKSDISGQKVAISE